MDKNFDFTSVNTSNYSFDFVRRQFNALQKIIDYLPELLQQKKLLYHIIDQSNDDYSSYVLPDYTKFIITIEDKGILEVLYAHYTFIISAAFKELQELSDIDLTKPIRIPINLANPIIVIANKLNVPPILTYYAHLILNWDHKNNMPIRRFSIIPRLSKGKETINDFELGFMLVHIQIEKKSLPIIKLLNTINNVCITKTANQFITITENLKGLSYELNSINLLLKTMYNQCSPSDFRKYIRIFLGDYRQIQLSDKSVMSLPGPSAAQSPTMLLFKYIFKANHCPNQNLSVVLNQAIQSIPRDRMEVIERIAQHFHSNLSIIKKNQQSFRAYIDLYYCYLNFLKEHFKLVFDYIIKPTHDLKNNSASNQKGTGHSNPLDLSERTKLIHLDIIKLCEEYHKFYNDDYFMRNKDIYENDF